MLVLLWLFVNSVIVLCFRVLVDVWFGSALVVVCGFGQMCYAFRGLVDLLCLVVVCGCLFTLRSWCWLIVLIYMLCDCSFVLRCVFVCGMLAYRFLV